MFMMMMMMMMYDPDMLKNCKHCDLSYTFVPYHHCYLCVNLKLITYFSLFFFRPFVVTFFLNLFIDFYQLIDDATFVYRCKYNLVGSLFLIDLACSIQNIEL
ncbi:hypothetical protein Smp_091660 [Schistosoma mansoni]|uniref:hypothetical protein n=1 Tax=Schistosoma mansoni TaxID=6183 RepID=UPI0001A628C2|nr:hypothetical protein Smp_091660 [Schistosoma mansoni]|eukprot:XP_018652990.1 hypothetical protein Smp_091660 [Schistosoma mansoni]